MYEEIIVAEGWRSVGGGAGGIVELRRLGARERQAVSGLTDGVRPAQKCYPLSDLTQAMRYLEEGHHQGKIVVTVNHNNKCDPYG